MSWKNWDLIRFCTVLSHSSSLVPISRTCLPQLISVLLVLTFSRQTDLGARQICHHLLHKNFILVKTCKYGKYQFWRNLLYYFSLNCLFYIPASTTGKFIVLPYAASFIGTMVVIVSLTNWDWLMHSTNQPLCVGHRLNFRCDQIHQTILWIWSQVYIVQLKSN